MSSNHSDATLVARVNRVDEAPIRAFKAAFAQQEASDDRLKAFMAFAGERRVRWDAASVAVSA